MKIFRYFVLALMSVSVFSCKWEKVDYGVSNDTKPFNEKVKSIVIDDIETLNIGTTKIVVPIDIEGLYKDAKEYKISDINNVMQVYFQASNSEKLLLVEARIIRQDKLFLEVSLPALTSDGTLILFINGEKKVEKPIRVKDIEWSLVQDNGDADSWSDKAKIHFTIKKTKDDEAFLTASLSATIREENSQEERPLSINPSAEDETIEITDLQPATSYIITYKLSGLNKSISKKITTEARQTIPNSSFEEWSEEKRPGTYWELCFPHSAAIGDAPHWDTLNRLTCRYGLDENAKNFRYQANSSTIPTTEAHTGSKAALIRTVGYGRNATAAGSWSLGVNISLGSLYLGSFNPEVLNNENALPNLGIPFISRPKQMTFWAKYKPKNDSDTFRAEIVLLSSSGEKIAEGILPNEDAGKTQGNEYRKYIVPIEYSVYNVKPAKMYIRFISGNITDNKSSNINYASVRNDSEHVGSMLFVDDVDVVY